MARPKKIHHFKLKEFRNASNTLSWRVTGTKADGTRVRSNYADKPEAIQALADLEAEYAGHVDAPKARRTRLSPDELADAEAATFAIPGRRLSSVVSHYLALEARAKEKGINLDVALSFVEGHYRAETKSVTVFDAYNDFVAGKTEGAEKTETHYKSSLKLLLTPDPNKLVHDFTVGDIEKILGKYKNVNSKRTYRRAFSAFFNWAVRHHCCLENPCDRLDKLPKDMSQIAALSLEEAKRLLYAATQLHDGAAASCVAIGLFAGLRPSELRDLKSEDILKEKVRVSGGKLRRKLKRSVPTPPVLAAWLKDYPFKGMPKGWDTKLKALKKATKAAKWVQDIIRHTSITFQAERDKNEALTAYNNGTSKQMMDRHYRDIIDDEKTVAEFWSLTPTKLLAKKPAIELPTKPRVVWPANKALEKLVWEKPMIHAAKDIGVSDVSVRKRCISLGITLPPTGYWIKKTLAR